ncbi:hypothetical protein CRX72_13290 [Pantoea sp. BRM17]|nr:hypothetical protein CRX72_13290 [Pantoea sp. BRM17]
MAEVIEACNFDDDTIIVNVQGDEPMIPAGIVRQVADNLAAAEAGMATLAVPIADADEAFNPNARYASTRLPGKPLVDIHGKPMVVHVMERARESGADRVIVATDHPEVAAAVTAAGGEVCMTRADHQSGPFT